MAAAPAVEPASIRSRTFSALTDNPNYRRFYVGQGVSLIGTWLQDAAVSWLVFEMTGSEWWLGIVSASGVMPGLLVGLFAGALADRVVPRTMILAMQVAQMLLAFALAALVAGGVVRIGHMIAILALTRICVTFEMPSRQVFLYELVGRAQLMNAIALNSGLFNASRVIGPALAGLFLARFGATAPFVVNGVSYLAAIGSLLSIRVGPRAPATGTGPAGAVLGGLGYLARDRRVAWLFALMAFFGTIGMGYTALVPAYARRVVHTQAVGYSVLLSAGGLGATLGALVVASLGGLERKERLVLAGMGVFSGALATAGVLPGVVADRGPAWGPVPAAALCLFGTGFGAILFYSATQTLIQTAVPDELRGRIMGIWMIVFSGSVPLGALWAGLLARSRGVAPVMILSAALCAAAALGVGSSGVLGRKDFTAENAEVKTERNHPGEKG
ncbi:MAG TPA: MFS transporter [Isosphaeraceae bacterium]